MKGQLHHQGLIIALTVIIMPMPGASAAAEEKPAARPTFSPKPSDFTIICTLYNGDAPAIAKDAPSIPITFDPRFLIGARIETVTFGSSPWKVSSTLRFVIHSPARTFGGYDFSGRRFTMTFSRFQPTTNEDLVWFEPETRYILKSIEPLKPKATP